MNDFRGTRLYEIDPDTHQVIGLDVEEMKKSPKLHLNQITFSLVHKFIPGVAKFIGIREEDLERRLVSVNLNKSPALNGSTRSSDSWKTFEINLNVGLIGFAYHMAEVFASRITIDEDQIVLFEGSKIPRQVTVSAAKRLMTGFWTQDFIMEPAFKVGQFDLAQQAMRTHLFYDSLGAIIAHEFGHVVIELSSDEIQEHAAGIWAAKAVLTAMPGLTAGFNVDQKEKLLAAWGKEIGADLIGLQLNSSLGKSYDHRILIYTATALVFITSNMLERWYKKITGQDIRTDVDPHPPSNVRFNAMRYLVEESNPPRADALVEGFERISLEILEEV